nr:hypothetical protein [Tanacetum cinerariifolium]
MMGRDVIFIQILVLHSLLMFPNLAFAQLQKNYYANMCPDVETIVEKAVAAKVKLQHKTSRNTFDSSSFRFQMQQAGLVNHIRQHTYFDHDGSWRHFYSDISSLLPSHVSKLIFCSTPKNYYANMCPDVETIVEKAVAANVKVQPKTFAAELKQNYYANICPNVETIVLNAVAAKVKLQPKSIPATLWLFVLIVSSSVPNAVAAKVKLQPKSIPATLRLFFHDCFVQGCDASNLIQSSGSEKDHEDNLSLAKDGFDILNQTKAAVDAVPSCKKKVSCADILTMATKDVIKMLIEDEQDGEVVICIWRKFIGREYFGNGMSLN